MIVGLVQAGCGIRDAGLVSKSHGTASLLVSSGNGFPLRPLLPLHYPLSLLNTHTLEPG